MHASRFSWAWPVLALLTIGTAQARATWTLTDLGLLQNGTQSRGSGIDASGGVAGSADNDHGATHAVLASAGGLVELGTLGGRSSFGNAISGGGAVGASQVAG